MVPAWGARRILEYAKRKVPHATIAGVLGTSVSSVERIIAASGLDGEPREPRQGQGKIDDRRWVFDGPRGAANVRALEQVMERGDPDELMQEVHVRWMQAGVGGGAYSTMCRALHKKLGYTTKRLSTEARERDPLRCDIWHNNIRTRFTSEQLLCVDESSADNRVRNRRYGTSKRGRPARGRNCFFHHGTRYSVLAPFDLEHGFLDCKVVEGGFTSQSFLDALRMHVVRAERAPAAAAIRPPRAPPPLLSPTLPPPCRYRT